MVAVGNRTRGRLGRFRDEDGLALTEALIVLPLIVLFLAASIESAAMMMQWNRTVKAIQVGARFATVSDPLTSIATLRARPTGAVDGDRDPLDATRNVTCGAGTIDCDADALARLMTGSDGQCGGSPTPGGRAGICDIAPFIRPENIRISYSSSGLGYVGRPAGPVVVVTLEMRNLYFDFFVLGAVLRAFGSDTSSLPIPTHPVSLVSEDMSDCEGC